MHPRNSVCPCGSGKKYKNCCLRKDQEAALEKQKNGSMNEEVAEEPVVQPRFSTLRIFLIATAALAAIALIVFFVGFPKIGGSIFGIGMLILIMYASFRNPPSLRKDPGNGGNIDFGTRNS